MQEIKMNEKAIGYIDDPKEFKNFLPNGAPSKFEMLGSGNDRKLTYGNDVYEILKSNKKVGVDTGDICPVCRLGIVEDVAGCRTCVGGCSAQLKCGL